MATTAELGKITLFEGLQEGELRELSSRAQRRSLQAEETFIREGARSDELFVILSGKVKVYLTDPNGKKHVLDIRGAGQYVGEMALDEKPRSASVRAMVPTEVAVIPVADFKAFLIRHPEVALQVIRNLIRLTRGHNVRTLQDVRSRADLQRYIEQLRMAKADELPSVRRWFAAKRWILFALLVFAIAQFYFLDVLLEMMSIDTGNFRGLGR